MEAYAQALLYAIPVFLLLIGIEAFAAWRMGIRINRGADMVASLSSGTANIVKEVLGLSIAIVSYDWLVNHIAIFDLGTEWYVWVIAFIAKDFAGYWIHRMEHRINIFWNRHIIHHSSEEFNLSCALRQSISEVFSFVALLLLPAALLGVPTVVIAIISPIQLFLQFWYHTRLINKMGFLEKIIVTPSHHRVHHAINPEYLDKNYGQIFIIWDKLFGTFQPELKEVPAVYGVKRPVHTWNPMLIGVQHVWLILSDAWYTKSWKDKLRIWFMPTGWRPADVAAMRPVFILEDPYSQVKYDPAIHPNVLRWSFLQYWITLAFTLTLFVRFSAIGFPNILLYGLFIFLSIFSLTSMLDKARYAVPAEWVRGLFGLGIMYFNDGAWFGVTIPMLNYCIAGYLVISLCVTTGLYYQVMVAAKLDDRGV
jgi:alkylglycerol monooxygenase